MNERSSVLLFLLILAGASYYFKILVFSLVFLAIALLYAISSTPRRGRAHRPAAAKPLNATAYRQPAIVFPSSLKIKYKPDINKMEQVEKNIGRAIGKGVRHIADLFG